MLLLAENDYNSSMTISLQLYAGTVDRVVYVPIVDDFHLEDEEKFFALLLSDEPFVIVDPDFRTVHVTIIDNDSECYSTHPSTVIINFLSLLQIVLH